MGERREVDVVRPTGGPPHLRKLSWTTNRPFQMATAVTPLLPIILLFLLTQRYFVRGIQMTGFK